jgi:hypothetical protein
VGSRALGHLQQHQTAPSTPSHADTVPAHPAAAADYGSRAKESVSGTAAQMYGSGTKMADKAYEAAATATPGTKAY